ncbi:hypothetical protein [Kitasatospora sp. LaBMicrA B282]|uniref:hypothetical protein n=1 Tax=Kitasatospora sp. LaBMicrA B282 TaxID=3420949 RepID=UPI003D13D880
MAFPFFSASRPAFPFGIYPGALLGSDTGYVQPVRPDEPTAIGAALQRLQGPAEPLLVRAYRSFPAGVLPDTPAEPLRLLGGERRLDLVLCYREPAPHPDAPLDRWLDHIRAAVGELGPHLAAVQVCEEPNVDLPPVDGSIPGVRRALVQGVVAAKEAATSAGLDLAVGFNAAPSFDPADTFWRELGELADAEPRFRRSLDYVGVDFFPDVFRPIPPGQLAAAVTGVLTHLRTSSLAQAGIGPDVPLRICEHGWPTGPGRSEQRQAEVLAEVVRTVIGLRTEPNLGGYSCFALRDANSAGEGRFDRFGLLHDDYTPKPAFDTYRQLIAEFGRRSG